MSGKSTEIDNKTKRIYTKQVNIRQADANPRHDDSLNLFLVMEH